MLLAELKQVAVEVWGSSSTGLGAGLGWFDKSIAEKQMGCSMITLPSHDQI